MKKILAMALSLVLVLGLTLSGTIAYLTDTDSTVNVMTVGNVDIEQLENGKPVGGFDQGQPLYPAYYADNAKIEDIAGAIEKRVNVKNEGSAEAYVRTLIAFEAGDLSKTDFDKYIHTVWETQPAHWFTEAITINGVNYYVACVDYDKVAAGAETADSLQYVYMDKTATNDIVLEFDDSYEILALSQAVQTNNFPNKETAWAETFGDVTTVTSDEVAEWFGDANAVKPFTVSNAEQFKALYAQEGNITVVLAGDITLTQKNDDGGHFANATSLTILGNGHTLTLDGQMTGHDWHDQYYAAIVAPNADVTVKDLTIVNNKLCEEGVEYSADRESVYTFVTGTTVTYDNVTFEGGVQVSGNETFVNCSFTEDCLVTDDSGKFASNGKFCMFIDHEYGEGTFIVNLENCTFDASGYGCVKVAGDKGAKITVNVEGCTFENDCPSNYWSKETPKYDIKCTGNNITVNDLGNNTWSEGERGGFTPTAKTSVVTVSNLEDLKAAIKNADITAIYLEEGEYADVLDVRVNRSLTIAAVSGADVEIAGINGQSNNNSCNITIKGVTIDNTLQTAGWYTGTAQNNKPCVGVWGGNYTFEDCVFNVSGESKAETGVMSWWTTDKGVMNFTNCTFNGVDNHKDARGMQIYGNYDLNVTGCTFNTHKDYSLKYVGEEGCKAVLKGNKVYNTTNFVQLGSAPYAGENYAIQFTGNTLGENINHIYVDNAEGQSIIINGVAKAATTGATY